MENKYQNGKIYKITDAGYNKCYYGSTVQTLSLRMAGHRKKYKAFKAGRTAKVSVFDIFDEYDVENCKIELVELYPCENLMELQRKEGYYIQHNDCVNKITNGRTPKEYYEVHKGCILSQRQEYYTNNREKILEYKHLHYLDNLEVERERDRRYYWENRDKIREKASETYNCTVCHCCITQRHKARHENSQQHLDALNGITPKGTICSICNGTYTLGRRERHEQSKKHQQALTTSR